MSASGAQTQSPVAHQLTADWGWGWETFTADEFPVTGSRSIPDPGSLLQSRSSVSPGPGPGHTTVNKEEKSPT